MFKKEAKLFCSNSTLTPLIAIFTLVGTIVGAGILGIPYVVAKAGVLYGLILITVIGLAFLYLNLFAGEVVLRTKGQHQLTGYAEKYLGKVGKGFMALSLLVNIYGALTAYLIGEGITLQQIFNFGTPLSWTLLFFAFGVIIVYQGIKTTGKTELYLISLLLLIVILIGIFSFNNTSYQNFTFFNLGQLFLPYGVILFAFMGSPGIPEVYQVLEKRKQLMKMALVVGSLIPVILYLMFTTTVIGVVGIDHLTLLEPNQRIATVALSLYANPLLSLFANILAILSMFTSFLTLGLALVQAYHYDFNLPKNTALVLTFFIPLLIVVFNLTTFITVLGFTGAIAGGLDGILITLMYWKAKTLGERKPEYSLKPHKVFGTALITMFVLGMFYQIWSVIS